MNCCKPKKKQNYEHFQHNNYIDFIFISAVNSNGDGTDMVDSGSGDNSVIHRPEEETVKLLKNKMQRSLNSNTCSPNKHTNNDGDSRTFDRHRKNCDILREKNATNSDEINGDNKTTNQTENLVDNFDDDPYAELQSYLDKVKVSSFKKFFSFLYNVRL